MTVDGKAMAGRRNIIQAKPLTRWTTARRLWTAAVADSQRRWSRSAGQTAMDT
jgi:hypothetical protein